MQSVRSYFKCYIIYMVYVKMLKIFAVCLFVGLVSVNSNSEEFPSDIQRCHRGDNLCIQNALEYIIKKYPHGNPALNLPSIEPIHVKNFDIIHEKEGNDDLHINWKIKNLDHSGFGTPDTKYTIEGFEKDIESSNVTIKINIPKFRVTGSHQLRLKFKKRPSHGKGNIKVEFDNIDFTLNFIPTTFTKNGKEYLKIKTLTVDYIPTNVALDLDDLFDGNKDLSDKEHKFINEHGVELFQKLREIIGAAWVPIFTEMIDSIFAKFPLDELFLD